MHPFGVPKYALHKIESTSRRISDSLSTQASTASIHGVELCRLGLQMIASASQTILQALDEVSSSNDCILDESVSAWLSSQTPMECRVAMEMMEDVTTGGGARSTCNSSTTESSPPTDNKLRETVHFFNELKDRFDFLLTMNVWNWEALIQRSSGVHIGGADRHTTHDGTPDADHALKTSMNVGNARTGITQSENDPLSMARDDALLAGTNPRAKQNLQKLEDVLSWLNGLDCGRKHQSTCSLRRPGTCTWFSTTNAYKEWRSGEKPFLWLSGKAGAGKSVLVASTIEYLKNTLEDNEMLVFFYCHFTDKRSTSAAEVMRSLLSQLVRQLRDRGVIPGDLLKTILEEKSNGALSLTDTQHLYDFLSRATKSFVPRPLIVIDALDECTDLELLLTCLAAWTKDQVRLLVTSRPLQTVKDFFDNLPCLSLEDNTKALTSDINVHVTNSIESSPYIRRLDVALKTAICAVLNRKADGMFKWVQCQIDVLNECRTMRDIWERLNSLPTGLEETYERILRDIDERPLGATLAWRALDWLVLSLEPLQFCQLDEVLSVDVEQRQFDHGARPMNRPALLDALSSLVIYDEDTDIITLSHFSVKEYLMRALTRSKLPCHVRQQDGHTRIARFCMCYISLYLSQPRHGRAAKADLQSWPMLAYVFSSGFDHLAHINGGSIPLLKALMDLQSHILQHPSEWDQLCDLREEQLRWPYLGPTWPSSKHDSVLYILIAYASERLLHTFLTVLPKHLRSKPKCGTNPLVYASELHKTEHAITLLSQLGTAYLDIRGLVLDDSQEVLPLEIAVERDNYVLVDKFLSLGSSVPGLLLERATCMPWCSTRVLARLLQTHQFMEWAITNSKDERPYRGVFSSARPGTGDTEATEKDHIVMAQRLLQVGCDISVDRSLGMELAERATYAGHVSVLEHLFSPDIQPPSHLFLAAAVSDAPRKTSALRFLIHHGVDIHTVSPAGESGLHLIMSSLWEERCLEATEILIEAGCDPRACNSRGETSLHKAVKHGHISVVKYLLSLETTLYPLPFDVLRAGLESASTAPMIRFLVERGVDVRAVTPNGDTALHLAMGSYSEQDCLETVKILVKAQCDPWACTSMGDTLIHAAIRTGYVSVMEYLLDLNVPLPPDILRFALEQPSSGQMIRLLVAKGADVYITVHSSNGNDDEDDGEDEDDDDGETTLLLVIESGSYPEEELLQVVKILVEAGASFRHSERPIMSAVDLGYTSLVRYLVEQGVPLPFHILLLALRRASNPQMIRFLVDKGVDLHGTHPGEILDLVLDPESYREEECLEIVKILVDAGVDAGANIWDDELTLIEAAIGLGYISLVGYLLAQNVPLPPDSDIFLVALHPEASAQMIQFLLETGANPHAVAADGLSALHLAFDNVENDEDRLEIAKRLNDAGATIGDSETLEAAIRSGCTSLAVDLLARNDSFPLPPASSILLTALRQQSSLRMVRFLVKNGANLHSVTYHGDTGLHVAMQSYFEADCLEIVKTLVDAGCNPWLCDSYGQMPIHLALKFGFGTVARYLLLETQNIPLPPDILCVALQWRSSTLIIRLLLERGADVHFATTRGDTALHLAVTHYEEPDCLESVKILINAGCDTRRCNSNGTTFIRSAMDYRYTSVVDYVLSLRVPLPSDILLVALERRSSPQIIRSLVERGADVNVVFDAMHLYSEQDCSEIREILNHGSVGNDSDSRPVKRSRLELK